MPNEQENAGPKLATLPQLQAAQRWRIVSNAAVLSYKRSLTPAEVFAAWRDHLGYSDKVAADHVRSGGVVLEDSDDGKKYSGGGLARFFGLDDGNGQSTENAAGAATVVEPVAVGPSARVSEQPVSGGGDVGAVEAKAPTGPAKKSRTPTAN